MKARLVQIGNSRGIRIPESFIKEAGLTDEVELQVRNGTVIIRPSHASRSTWEAAAKALIERVGGPLLDLPTSTHFDEAEWKW